MTAAAMRTKLFFWKIISAYPVAELILEKKNFIHKFSRDITKMRTKCICKTLIHSIVCMCCKCCVGTIHSFNLRSSFNEFHSIAPSSTFIKSKSSLPLFLLSIAVWKPYITWKGNDVSRLFCKQGVMFTCIFNEIHDI